MIYLVGKQQYSSNFLNFATHCGEGVGQEIANRHPAGW
jgi:hypothetical protein